MSYIKPSYIIYYLLSKAPNSPGGDMHALPELVAQEAVKLVS